ncbi:MAG: hypothetical protein ABI707_09365 [Ferruginibacter sp.]
MNFNTAGSPVRNTSYKPFIALALNVPSGTKYGKQKTQAAAHFNIIVIICRYD